MFCNDSRGVSDTLGYILLFAVIFTSITAVVAFSGPVLQEQQDAEYMLNTARAFEVFSTNLATMHRDQSPARETEIRYKGGTVFQNEDVFITMNVTRADGSTAGPFLFASTPVSYQKGERGVSYEGGAVIRSTGDSAIMRERPPYQIRDDRIMMTMVTTSVLEDEQTLSGNGKIAVVSRRVGAQEVVRTGQQSSGDVTLEMTVNSPRYKSWELYFEDQSADSVTVNETAESVTAEFTTDQISIREVQIEIEARQ